MKYDEKMVKKEISGTVLSVGGRKANEYTEKYDLILPAVTAAEEIQRGEPCTPKRIGYVRTGQLTLNDMTESPVKEDLKNLFENVMEVCKGNENRACESLPFYKISGRSSWIKYDNG